MILPLIAAAHLYLLPWKMLFLLPAGSDKPCGLTSLRYGPPDGKWESGSNPSAPDCRFRVSVHPGPLLPAWGDLPPRPADQLDVTYTVQGDPKPRTASVKVETVSAPPGQPADFSVKASKVKSSVKVEVTNKAEKPLVVGDAVTLRGKPRDDCVGPGPAAVLSPGETLVDVRPGLLSPSMKVFVSVFTGEKDCKWIEVRR
jgi:hypothetical protein